MYAVKNFADDPRDWMRNFRTAFEIMAANGNAANLRSL